jgi:membrane dipeptidase
VYNIKKEVTMMKVFDTHADIGMDVLTKVDLNESDILKTYHLSKFHQGDVQGVNMACFFEGHETLKTAKKMISELKKEIMLNEKSIHLSLDGSIDSSKLNALMSIEGMCFIKSKPEVFLDWAYLQGVRIGSLAWNDTNALATGSKGDPARGLTKLGKRAIKHMNSIGMIIDISHTNEKSFYDILETTTKPIMATHSNARALCNVDRNLTNQQIKAITDTGGLIGLVAARYFVHDDLDKQNAHTLALHAKHIVELSSIEHVCVGFDYMDFLGDPFGKEAMAQDLQDASMSQNLVHALLEVGFTREEVEKIAFDNIVSFLKKNLLKNVASI